MTLLLKHWQLIAWVVAALTIVGFLQARDARLRAEGRAQVYLAQADSLQAVADSFRVAVQTRDSVAAERVKEAEERIMEMEVIVASIEENEPRMEDDTDQTISMIRDMVDDSVKTLVDSLDFEITQERVERTRERLAWAEVVAQKDLVISELEMRVADRDARIASLETALSARVAAGAAQQQTNKGSFEKAVYAIGGVAIGYLAGRVF